MIKNIRRFYKPGIEVFRATKTVNELGDYINVFNLIYIISGLIRPTQTVERIEGKKITYTSGYTMYCSAEVDLELTDEIQDTKGQRYRITEIINPMNFNNHLEVGLQRKE